MTTRKILVVVDPTCDEQPAVDRAAWLAKKTSASVELFICDFDADIDAGRVSTMWIDQPNVRDNLLAVRRKKLEALALPLQKDGIEVEIDVAWDFPLDQAIVRKVAASKPWLVAKDTHHHNVLRRTIFSNTDWHLIRDCPAPLLLVKPDRAVDNAKIIAAVDPLHAHDKDAELDHDILKLASMLAGDIGGSLHVVHSYTVPATAGVADAALLTEIMTDVEQHHQKGLSEFLAEYDFPEGRTHLLEGAAYKVLPEIAASEDAGVIVMGAVSRSGLDRVIVGSTAERVLDRLPCDLLIVKRQDEANDSRKSAAVG